MTTNTASSPPSPAPAVASPAVPSDIAPTAPLRRSYYIYTTGVRVWHWATFLLIITLSITGYLIASPPTSIAGEASDAFVFGYIRTIHFMAGYVLAVSMVWRTTVALTGGPHARQIFYVPVWRKQYWTEMVETMKWYLFLARKGHRGVDHNAMARTAMFGMFVLGTFFMIFTGFGLYAEGAGAGSWQDAWFGWVRTLAGNSMMLHSLHHLGMWLLVVFAVIHTYLAIRDEIMGDVSTISSMFSGWRTFRKSGD